MTKQALKKFVLFLLLPVNILCGVAHADEAQRDESKPDTMALYQATSDLMNKWPKTWYKKGQEPETAEQRSQRMDLAALSVVNTLKADKTTKFKWIDAAALITALWYHESAGEYYVHAGGVSPLGTQDHGRARCMGQVQTWPGNTLLTPEQHAALPGLTREATERCAAATLSYFWEHARKCLKRDWSKPLRADEAALLFAAYGAGHCAPMTTKAKIRAFTWQKNRIAIDRDVRLNLLATKDP